MWLTQNVAGSKNVDALWVILYLDPTSQKQKKGLVKFEWFIESAVLILGKSKKLLNVTYVSMSPQEKKLCAHEWT